MVDIISDRRKDIVKSKYSIDGIETPSDNPEFATEPTSMGRHTMYDQRDMWRMGKLQELRVLL